MNLISWPGFSPQSFIISALDCLAHLHVWLAVGSHLGTLLRRIFPPVVNVMVKDLIRRPRPGMDLVHVFRILNSYSFPSGHVMFYVGFFGFIWFLVTPY